MEEASPRKFARPSQFAKESAMPGPEELFEDMWATPLESGR